MPFPVLHRLLSGKDFGIAALVPDGESSVSWVWPAVYLRSSSLLLLASAAVVVGVAW